jgi:hypothetical protein
LFFFPGACDTAMGKRRYGSKAPAKFLVPIRARARPAPPRPDGDGAAEEEDETPSERDDEVRFAWLTRRQTIRGRWHAWLARRAHRGTKRAPPAQMCFECGRIAIGGPDACPHCGAVLVREVGPIHDDAGEGDGKPNDGDSDVDLPSSPDRVRPPIREVGPHQYAA